MSLNELLDTIRYPNKPWSNLSVNSVEAGSIIAQSITGPTGSSMNIQDIKCNTLEAATGIQTYLLVGTNNTLENVLFNTATGLNKLSVPIVECGTGIKFPNISINITPITGSTLDSYYHTTGAQSSFGDGQFTGSSSGGASCPRAFVKVGRSCTVSYPQILSTAVSGNVTYSLLSPTGLRPLFDVSQALPMSNNSITGTGLIRANKNGTTQLFSDFLGNGFTTNFSMAPVSLSYMTDA